MKQRDKFEDYVKEVEECIATRFGGLSEARAYFGKYPGMLTALWDFAESEWLFDTDPFAVAAEWWQHKERREQAERESQAGRESKPLIPRKNMAKKKKKGFFAFCDAVEKLVAQFFGGTDKAKDYFDQHPGMLLQLVNTASAGMERGSTAEEVAANWFRWRDVIEKFVESENKKKAAEMDTISTNTTAKTTAINSVNGSAATSDSSATTYYTQNSGKFGKRAYSYSYKQREPLPAAIRNRREARRKLWQESRASLAR